jgi:hypothetical protein
MAGRVAHYYTRIVSRMITGPTAGETVTAVVGGKQAAPTSRLLQEDGVSFILLEDGVSKILLG